MSMSVWNNVFIDKKNLDEAETIWLLYLYMEVSATIVQLKNISHNNVHALAGNIVDSLILHE